MNAKTANNSEKLWKLLFSTKSLLFGPEKQTYFFVISLNFVILCLQVKSHECFNSLFQNDSVYIYIYLLIVLVQPTSVGMIELQDSCSPLMTLCLGKTWMPEFSVGYAWSLAPIDFAANLCMCKICVYGTPILFAWIISALLRLN